MKKDYIQPQVEIVEAETQALLAESLPVGTDTVTSSDDVMGRELELDF